MCFCYSIATMKQRIFHAREIVYKKGDRFLAISLDFDLMAEGFTMGEALDRLHDATIGYLSMCYKEKESDKEIYRKAPKKYFDMYELFKELDAKKKKRPFAENFIGKATYSSSQLSYA